MIIRTPVGMDNEQSTINFSDMRPEWRGTPGGLGRTVTEGGV